MHKAANSIFLSRNKTKLVKKKKSLLEYNCSNMYCTDLKSQIKTQVPVPVPVVFSVTIFSPESRHFSICPIFCCLNMNALRFNAVTDRQTSVESVLDHPSA